MGLVGVALVVLGIYCTRSESLFHSDGSLNLLAGGNMMIWGGIFMRLEFFSFGDGSLSYDWPVA